MIMMRHAEQFFDQQEVAMPSRDSSEKRDFKKHVLAILALMMALMLTLSGCADHCEGRMVAALDAGDGKCIGKTGHLNDDCNNRPHKWCWFGDDNDLICAEGSQACLAVDVNDGNAFVGLLDDPIQTEFRWVYNRDGTLQNGLGECITRTDDFRPMTAPCPSATKIKFIPASSCDIGYVRAPSNTTPDGPGFGECVPAGGGQCSCENGYGSVGKACPANGTHLCVSCKTGYRLDGSTCRKGEDLPDCTCNASHALGSVLCKGPAPDQPCAHATWDCANSVGLCAVGVANRCGVSSRVPQDLQNMSAAAALDAECAKLKSESDCFKQGACEWSATSLRFSWACLNAAGADIGCDTYGSYDQCTAQIGCEWKFIKVTDEQCGLGVYTPCHGPRDACGNIKIKRDCDVQYSCQWNDRMPCTCPATHIGVNCEDAISEWQPRGGLCLSTKADMERCHALTYSAYFQADHGACQGNVLCAEWQEIRGALSTMFSASVVDIFSDLVGFLFTSVFLFMTCRGGGKPYALFVSGAMMALTFTADVASQSVFLRATHSAEGPVQSFVDSFCFSQGSGYEAIVEVRDKFKETRRNSLLMIIIAVLGTLSEIGQAVLPILTKTEDASWGKIWLGLAIASALAIPGELAFSLYDFLVNILDLIHGIESIEKAVLGSTPLERGFVCVELHPNLKQNVGDIDVSIADGTLMLVGICLGTTAFILMLLCCVSCLMSRGS